MKICSDILNLLKIETVYLIADHKIYMCMPLEIKDKTWFVACDTDNLSGNVELKIKYRGSFIYLNCTIMRKENNTLYSFTYEITITEDLNNIDNFKYSFLKEIKDLEARDKTWNKRKEERFELGLDENVCSSICVFFWVHIVYFADDTFFVIWVQTPNPTC